MFACLMFHSAMAQKNWTVEWGKVYEHDKKEGNIVKILASDAAGFYVLRSTGPLGRSAAPSVIVLNPFVSKKQSAWIDYYDFKFKKFVGKIYIC